MIYNCKVLFIFQLLFLLTGCGIYSFSGISIPEETKTFTVLKIKSEASLIHPNFINSFTNTLIDKCQQEINLSFVEENPNISFSGRIKKYEIQPVSIQNDETAAQNRLTISIEINYINHLDDSKNFQTTFTDYIDFNSDLIFSNIEDDLNENLINTLLEDLFNMTFMDW